MTRPFISLISSNYGIIHTVLQEYVPRMWQADVQQDILAAAWQAYPRFKGDCKPSTWLYRISLYVCIEWRRKERARIRRDEAYRDEQAYTTGEGWLERFERILHGIPTVDLDILVMHYAFGLRGVRIGRLTGLSPGAVKKRIYEAKRRINK